MSPARAALAPSFAIETQFGYAAAGGARATILSSAMASFAVSFAITGGFAFSFIHAWSGQSGSGRLPHAMPASPVTAATSGAAAAEALAMACVTDAVGATVADVAGGVGGVGVGAGSLGFEQPRSTTAKRTVERIGGQLTAKSA